MRPRRLPIDARISRLRPRAGFPEVVVHERQRGDLPRHPDSTVLQDGDIVNIDVTAFRDGVHGDTDATYLVGDVDEESRLLVERTRAAMLRGVHAVEPGRTLNVIGRVIESYARRFGYGVVRDFTGHGIGTAFHSGLVVPHYDDPAATTVLESGMTFTIEPMLNLGTHEWRMWDDGWTVLTETAAGRPSSSTRCW